MSVSYYYAIAGFWFHVVCYVVHMTLVSYSDARVVGRFHCNVRCDVVWYHTVRVSLWFHIICDFCKNENT